MSRDMTTLQSRLENEIDMADTDDTARAIFSVALALTHVADRLGDIGFGDEYKPGTTEAIAMALGYKRK